MILAFVKSFIRHSALVTILICDDNTRVSSCLCVCIYPHKGYCVGQSPEEPSSILLGTSLH